MMDIRIFILIAFYFLCFQLHAQEFYLGADLSYVNELESCGAIYKDRSGIDADLYTLISNEGANIVRLRLWHDPQWTDFSNLEDVKVSIGRAKTNGMKVLLDFHYSDFWADPGRQWRPAAWEEVETNEALGDSLYKYTYNTLLELNEEGLLPEMVQIGNETNGNILIKRGDEDLSSGSPNLYPVNWSRQSMLFNRALKAVEDIEITFDTDIRTVIHVADPGSATSWLQNAYSNGLLDFDIIGLSYYPQWHDLGVREVGASVDDLKNQFGKEVLIVEAGYPWTSNGQDQANNVLNFDSRLFTYSNNFSIEVQRDFLIELSWLVKENGGLGVIYWEPAWVSSSCQTYWGTGSHWENAALFDFDGQLHSGADFLSYDYSEKPVALGEQQVSFKVDMTAINTEKGVFVTGAFTGENWEFESMTKTSGALYEYTATIPGRSEGAYIFYNNNQWSDSHREIVPENCARLWGTHREYWVRGEQAEFYFSWGRCDQIPNEMVPGIDEPVPITVLPTIVSEELNIRSEENLMHFEVFDLGGKKYQVIGSNTSPINVAHLSPGLYVIRIATDTGTRTLKFVKI